MGLLDLSPYTPIINQPNSTEDPKIGSAFGLIQTLLNGNLDSTNLIPGFGRENFIAKSVNYQAVNGDLVLAQTGVTVTAPTVALNSSFTVVAGYNVTGSAPAVVARKSLDVLAGYGAPLGVTSINLGTPGAWLRFISDGVNWYYTGNGVDTGWVALTLGSGFSAAPNCSTPAARMIADRVELRGGMTGGSGAGATLATISSPFRPAVYREFMVTTFGGTNGGIGFPARLNYLTGVLGAQTTVYSNDVVSLDSVFYYL
jgi:hypothetical protein